MTTIVLHIEIAAPLRRCFDLARSIDFHMHSMRAFGERAVEGRTTGLIELDEHVTWEARHMGVRQRLTSRITAFEPPHRFVDEMVRGAFASLHHENRFEATGPSTTRLTDTLTFRSPLGPLGRLADIMFVRGYMRRLIHAHQQHLKAAAESGDWAQFVA